MATKKDLVEAYSFSRRRLVTAFVSGAPGGREVEPTRPGRAIVGGLALAVLLVAGGAVAGIIKSPTSVDWTETGLVSQKETGADYLVLEKADGSANELRPLANITSAMLILGPEPQPREVARKDFDGIDPGAPIGILGAPQTPPLPGDLVPSGWTACTGVLDVTGADQPPTGIEVRVAESSDVTQTPDQAFVVETDGGVYLIAQSSSAFERGERAYAYRVPPTAASDRILNALAGYAEPTTVPDPWIGLFPAGGDLSLDTFGISAARFGKSWPGAASVPDAPKAKVGDLLTVGDTTFALNDTGAVELDDFALTLYEQLLYPRGLEPTRRSASQAPTSGVTGTAGLDGADWPTEVTSTGRPVGQLCAILDVEGDKPGVRLGSAADGSPASSEDVAFGDTDVSVEPGHGAFVLSGDWTEGGGPNPPFLVDDRGLAYPVGQSGEQTQLGYGDQPPVVVPNTWIKLMGEGPPLTIDAARCPPTSEPTSDCS